MPAILASNLVCLVTGLLTPLVTTHTAFFLLRFLQGFAYNSFYAIAYVLGKMKYSVDLLYSNSPCHLSSFPRTLSIMYIEIIDNDND